MPAISLGVQIEKKINKRLPIIRYMWNSSCEKSPILEDYLISNFNRTKMGTISMKFINYNKYYIYLPNLHRLHYTENKTFEQPTL